MGLTYKDAGVDIDAGEEVIDKLKVDVESTFTSEVLTGLGSFGALFAPDLSNYQQPVFVSGTDGVGTKLKIAFMMDQHDTIGIDLVAMSVNDILAQGAKPLFFLDYLATGKLEPDSVAEVVKGITIGCKESGCALIGGETAEMPDFYDSGEYDLAGFVVGMVDKEDVITGEIIKAGDKIVGLASNGLHSNGYTLARKVFFDLAGYDAKDQIEGLDTTLGEELLKPTKIYAKLVLKILKEYQVNGIAHITGGGLIENIPRILADDLQVVINKNSWSTQAMFNLIQEIGDIAEQEMYRTFNMGVGMILVVPEEEAEDIVKQANKLGEKAYMIGEVKKREKEAQLIIDN